MRTLFFVFLLASVSGCSGFKAVSRGQWKLVYADSAQRGADSKRVIITRDAWETEVAGGETRTWEPPPGYQFPTLLSTSEIGLQRGEIAGFIIDESTEVQLFADGDAVTLFWGEQVKRDVWVEDHDETVRESVLYVEGRSAGRATLRLARGQDQHDVPVTVK